MSCGTYPFRRHVVVVGAGLIGLAASRELAARGARVTVLDRAAPGSGATGVAFAWLTNQTYYRGGEALSADSARQHFALHRLAVGAWRRLADEIGDGLGIRWHGAVQLASNEPDRSLLDRDLERRLAWGSPSYPIGARQARQLLPSALISDDVSGFHTPDEGSVDPNAATAALARSAAALGVEVRPCTEVVAVDGSAGRASAVVTRRGRIDCDDVLVTCGVDSPELLEPLGVTVPLIGSSGSIVHLAPVRRFLDPVLLCSEVHAIQRVDGRVVIARHYSGTPVGDPDDLDSKELHAEAARVLPTLCDTTIERITTGRRIVPRDGLPVVSRSPVYSNVHSVTTNAGITLGPALAQLVTTELLDGVDVDVLAPYRAARFEAK